jgi:hypothetical protein
VTITDRDIRRSTSIGHLHRMHPEDLDLTCSSLHRARFLFCLLENCTWTAATCLRRTSALSYLVRTTMDRSNLAHTSFAAAVNGGGPGSGNPCSTAWT